MKILKNTTGTKAVRITKDSTGTVIAMYIQIYNNVDQVLESKTFSTIKKADKWAETKIN